MNASKKLKSLTLIAAATASFGLHAQNYPDGKPITIVVPFAAGGPTDRVARDLAEALRKPLDGVMKLTVAGESAQGGATTLALQPIAVKLGRLEVVRGSLPLPEGFRPRQTTVQVLDRAEGKPLGMRVLLVR